jgi:membrane associated rhomboid family serine protease
MLDDRPYMRSDYRPPRTPFQIRPTATNLLIVALVIAFFAQYYQNQTYQQFIQDNLELSPSGLLRGKLWELLTFQFLHAGLFHLLFNTITLWSMGRYVEERLGKAHFLTLYLASGVAGGLLQCLLGLVLPRFFGGDTVGASAGIMGVTAAFAVLEPDATMLFMFFLPMRAKNLLYITLAACLLLSFLPAGAAYANGAHLGGILFAWFYVRWGIHWVTGLTNRQLINRRSRREELIRATTFRPPLAPRRAKPSEPVDLPSEEFISQEVDPILDKISAHGIQSLTDRERQILQAARSKMSKR